MKIDKRIPGAPPAKTAGVQGKTSAKAQSGSAAAAGDPLSLTAASTLMRSMEADLASVEVADSAKIEAVKAALADGSFAVNAEVVADRMIDEARQTLTKRPRKK